jgi:hypothetical protein
MEKPRCATAIVSISRLGSLADARSLLTALGGVEALFLVNSGQAYATLTLRSVERCLKSIAASSTNPRQPRGRANKPRGKFSDLSRIYAIAFCVALLRCLVNRPAAITWPRAIPPSFGGTR